MSWQGFGSLLAHLGSAPPLILLLDQKEPPSGACCEWAGSPERLMQSVHLEGKTGENAIWTRLAVICGSVKHRSAH
jgi:hypothetical protein